MFWPKYFTEEEFKKSLKEQIAKGLENLTKAYGDTFYIPVFEEDRDDMFGHYGLNSETDDSSELSDLFMGDVNKMNKNFSFGEFQMDSKVENAKIGTARYVYDVIEFVFTEDELPEVMKYLEGKMESITESKGNPYSESFEWNDKVKAFVTKYNLMKDVEVAKDGMTAKLVPKIAKDLEKTKKVFGSQKYAEKRLESWVKGEEDALKQLVAPIDKKIQVRLRDVSNRGLSYYAYSIELSKNGEEIEVEPGGYYYSYEAGSQLADSFTSWNWAAWLGHQDSPFFDDDFIDDYDYDDMSQWFEQAGSFEDKKQEVLEAAKKLSGKEEETNEDVKEPLQEKDGAYTEEELKKISDTLEDYAKKNEIGSIKGVGALGDYIVVQGDKGQLYFEEDGTIAGISSAFKPTALEFFKQHKYNTDFLKNLGKDVK